jgi:tripartite-type tricarboxylate transporter receptor subunit TctC
VQTMTRRAVAGLILMPAVARMAAAQEQWPSRPVQLVVGFAPGGPNDLVARLLAQRLTEQLGRPVLVENRPGANGNIAAASVARAAPDGHTLLYNSSSLGLSAALQRNLPFDPLRDLAPVNGTATLPLVLVVEDGFPARDFAGWAAAVRARPGHYNYGSPGVGNLAHIGMALVLKANGLEATHVPYRGSSEALTALLGGSTQFQLDSVNSPLGQIRAGRLRPLVVTSRRRSAVLPEVPTLAESGLAGVDISGWQGVMAPAGTPAPVVQRLGEEIARAMAGGEAQAALAAQGAYAIASSPAQYGAFLASEIARFKAVAEQLGLQLD